MPRNNAALKALLHPWSYREVVVIQEGHRHTESLCSLLFVARTWLETGGELVVVLFEIHPCLWTRNGTTTGELLCYT